MGKETKTIKPKNILIQVTEGGKSQPNVRIPLFMVKMGMKIGQTVNSKKSAEHGNELEMLKDIDIDAIVSSIGNGELTLPCLLVDVEDSVNDRHVKITLE